MKHKLENKIVQAWEFLKKSQKDDGHFEGLACTHEQEVVSKTPFTTSLILNALRPMRDFSLAQQAGIQIGIDNISLCADKAIAYLFTQKDTHHFAWNYWEQDDPRRKTLPYDLDDTALACAALQYWKPESMDGKYLAELAHVLIATEHDTGGPYNTWITDFKKDQRFDDCDIAVNANIAYMASLLGIHLPNLDTYFESAFVDGNFLNSTAISKYYQSPAVILYFISRGYRGDRTQLFLEKIKMIRNTLENSDQKYSAQENALLLSALSYFGADISNEEKCIENIINASVSQKINEKTTTCWPKETFYFERGDKDNMWYHQSDALTTSVCLEALALFSAAVKNSINSNDNEASDDKLFEKESEAIGADFITRANNKELAGHWVDRVFSHEWIRQSILLPHFIMRDFETGALISIFKNEITTEGILQKICYANLAGWIGYSLLDDITDRENGANESMIPFAEHCLQEMSTIYQNHFSKNQYKLVKKLLDETKSTDKNTDGQKSIGAVIAGLAIIDEQYFTPMIYFFRFFLEAKQMSDDIEDLIADLTRGNITSTGERVLRVFKNPEYNIGKDKEILLSIFWNDVYPTVHEEMSDILQKAIMTIVELPIAEEKRSQNYFIDLVANLQRSIMRTYNERKLVQDFLSAY